MDRCKVCLNNDVLELIYDFEYIDIETEEKSLKTGFICGVCGCIHIVNKHTHELISWGYEKKVGEPIVDAVGSWVTDQMVKRII